MTTEPSSSSAPATTSTPTLEEQLANYKLIAAKVAPLPLNGYDLTDIQLSGNLAEDKEKLRTALYAASDFPSALLADIVQQAVNAEGTPRELANKAKEAMTGLAPPRVSMGVLPADIIRERERLVKLRVSARITQLEAKLADLSADDPTRTKLLIELKSLQLWDLRKKVRADILQRAQAGATYDAAMNRSEMELLGRQISLQGIRPFRPSETPVAPSESSNTPLGRNRGLCSLLTEHFKTWSAETKNKASLWTKVNRAVISYHSTAEREEQKRQERLSKERIKALKADDEEAYLKLLDQQKDTRLAYLLNQTNEFLGTLSAQVRAQQAEGEEMMPGQDDEANVDYYQAAHRVREIVEKQPSILVGGQLKEYQLKGLEWLISLYNNRLNGILADEMGLGKTIQAISLISYLMENKGLSGPYLVIVPLSTMTNWSVEFDKWAPSVVKVEYKGTPAHRKNLQANLRHGRFNVLLTTYEYIIKDRPFLSKFKWLYMIIDEGHRMKNSHSKLSTTLSQYYAARFRLILTGTPLQNNLPELWSLLNFILPRIFNSSKTFEEWFNAPFASAGPAESVELNEEETLLIIRRLHKVLRPFLLRRLKKDVEADLPDKIELILKCPMSALQQRLYSIIKQQGVDDASTNSSFKRLNNTIMQLRKICNHPFTFEEVENLVNPSHINNELLYRVSGKFELLHRILPKFQATGHRVLMFFQMTAVITIMEDFLNMHGMKYLRLDGSTKAEDRTTMLHAFNDPKSPYFIFLLSTRAGGLGLNLQSADTVVIFDSDWNPHQDLQAQDRAHRIGQTRQVRIFRLVTVDSVEEYILERAQFKLSLDGKVIQAGKFDNKSTNEEREQMLRALLDEEREKNDEEDVYSDDDLNEIIARNDFELEQFRQMDAEARHPREGRLITIEELPAEYREIPKKIDASEHQRQLDMGRRKKTVNYDETMSDNQWLKTIEEDGTSPAKRIRLKVSATPNSINPSFFSVLDSLESACDDRGRSRSDIFANLPDAREYPDYYRIIKRPLSLACIRNSLCKGKYVQAEDLQADLDVMFNNAMTYNAEGSLVYEDAAWLMEYSHDLIAEISNINENNESSQSVADGNDFDGVEDEEDQGDDGEDEYMQVDDDDDFEVEEEEFMQE